MNRIVILLGFIISFKVFGESNKLNLQQIVENDKWTLAEGNLGEDKMFLRYRNEIKRTTDLTIFPKAIHIFWDYDSNDSGMPTAETNQEMEVFESRIVDALESDMTGMITAITTKAGTRHWLFYVKDTNSFAEKLHEMPQEKEAYPIEIEAETNENWEYYFENMYIPENP